MKKTSVPLYVAARVAKKIPLAKQFAITLAALYGINEVFNPALSFALAWQAINAKLWRLIGHGKRNAK